MTDAVVAPAAPAPDASVAPVAVAGASPGAASPVISVAESTPAVPAVAAVADAPAAPAAVIDAAKPADGVPAAAAAEAKPGDAKPGDKPADAAPADGDAKPADPVAEPEKPKPVEFKLPENIKADPATMTAYGNVLSKYGISQEAGQELLDFHANTIKTASEQMAQHQLDVWANTQKDWVADFDKSAGNRRDTILHDAKFAIADTIKDQKQRKAIWDVLALTGAGNHKAVIYGLAAIGKRLQEKSGAPATGVPNNGARSGTAAERRYGAKQS